MHRSLFEWKEPKGCGRYLIIAAVLVIGLLVALGIILGVWIW